MALDLDRLAGWPTDRLARWDSVRPVQIAVVGPGEDASQQDCRDAEEVGRLLAQAGAVVLTGGLGGVMAAAARGCTSAGGTCIGLLPGSDWRDGNEHLTVAVATGLGQLRNGMLATTADGLIAVGGSWGTLSEVAFAVRAGRPVVTLHSWTVSQAAGGPVPQEQADSPGDAVGRLLELLGSG